MITRIITSGPNQNGKMYGDLFEEASKSLGLDNPDDYISTLNQYFQNLPDLIKNTDTFKPKYMILPLDEEPFVINANTRAITVPTSFSKCASVQGDETAETIYFVIDRYFDTMDLNNQNIWIEWRNKEGTTYLDKEVFRDIESQPDKIVFGWGLSSAATAIPGSIEFAVRFYTIGNAIDPSTGEEIENEQEVLYSFSTLPAKIVIKESLSTDLLDDTLPTIDSTQLMLKRIVAATPDQGAQAVEKPVILDIRDFAPVTNGMVDIPAGTRVIIRDDSVEGYVQAYSPDAGKVTYQLVKDELSSNMEIVYLETNDIEFNKNTTYYIKQDKLENGNSVAHYEKYEGAAMPEDDTVLYEQYGKFAISEVGNYSIKVTNRKGASTNNVETTAFIAPAPEAPVIDTAAQHIEFEDEVTLNLKTNGDIITDEGVVSYQWSTADENNSRTVIEGATGTSYIASQEGVYVLTPYNTLNKVTVAGNPCKYYVSLPVETPVPNILPDVVNIRPGTTLEVVNEPFKTRYFKRALSYKWYRMVGDKIDTTADTLLSTEGAEYTPNTAGQYYVEVTNTYNTFTASAFSDIVPVA